MYGRFIEKDKYYGLYIVIKYKGGVYKSLGKASQVKIDDFDKFKSSLLKHFSMKDDFYHTIEAHDIIFNYNFVKPQDLDSNETVI